jgi:AcrR family transcriptional regulator
VTEQQSSPMRRYRKTKRAEDEQHTRARIVNAAEALHGSVGPARTSVSAIADRAGVTRATVYRHFPDNEALFLACSAQWMSRQRLPDPDRWTALPDPLQRFQAGLTDIYRYYRAGEQMITMIHRDAEAVPPRVAQQRITAEQRWLDTLLEPFPARNPRHVRAAVAHAAAFSTWRSLCVIQSLSNPSAVELMLGMVTAACPSEPGPGQPGTTDSSSWLEP